MKINYLDGAKQDSVGKSGPLGSDPPATPFPVLALPKNIRKLVESGIDLVPLDWKAVTALGVASIALQRGIYVNDGRGIEPVNIYGVVVASGYWGPSTVCGRYAKPLQDGEDSVPLRYLSGFECKPQDVATMMMRNQGRIGICAGQNGLFSSVRGRVNSSQNIDIMLKAHSGDTLRINRLGQPSEILRPALTTVLIVNREDLTALRRETTALRDFLSCWFYSCPDPIDSEEMRLGRKATPPKLEMEWESIVKRLLQFGSNPDNPTILTLAADALEILNVVKSDLETRLSTDLAFMSDWVGKLVGLICRFAAILHCLEQKGPLETTISAETLTNAVTIGFYALSHAERCYALMGVPAKAGRSVQKRIGRALHG